LADEGRFCVKYAALSKFMDVTVGCGRIAFGKIVENRLQTALGI
jgi:hypothetical protein